MVGIVGAVAQAGLLGILLKKLGDTRTALLGLASSCIAYVLYGLAFQGWMMYAIIHLCKRLLGFVYQPGITGIVSKAVDPRHQGITLGSLNSISSIMGVVAPLWSERTLLAPGVSGLPPTDLRSAACGIFLEGALAQAIALVQAYTSLSRDAIQGIGGGGGLVDLVDGSGAEFRHFLTPVVARVCRSAFRL